MFSVEKSDNTDSVLLIHGEVPALDSISGIIIFKPNLILKRFQVFILCCKLSVEIYS